MKKFFIICTIFILFFAESTPACLQDTNIKNKLFSITLPKEYSGLYETKTEKDKISIFHKESKKNGFGGFVFGIKAYKNPSEHATLPGGRKIGELIDKKGRLYDIVLKYPTDVQHDYTKSSEPPKSFKCLYDYGENPDIKGVKGSIYYKNQGMRGEDLYKDVLKKHVKAIREKWDSERLEKEEMSYMYNILSIYNKNSDYSANLLNKIGYVYYDINADGIDELLIGEIAEGNWKGIIYDIYTMVNRTPTHVISGGSRNRYFVCNNCFLCNEYSSGALESGVRIYTLLENSTELFHQVSFKYDGYTNSKKPWFLSYGGELNDNKWENVSENVYNERKKVFEKYEKINFIPLSTIKN